MSKLVIVESPTKAKTLKKFLGNDFIVESSVGHVRDLPGSAAEIPPELKKEPWARLGVNVDDDFKPLYVIHPDKKKKIAELKQQVKKADELLLATDEDREGEAISWHLLELLQPKVPVKRMVFHEITKQAILDSLEHTRDIDQHLVEAQEARRIIDRLYGYEVSPILWRKIKPQLSAGRVQSVAIRMIVEREQARMRFKAARYWDLVAELATAEGKTFTARLVTVDGKRLASGRSFDPDTGRLVRDDLQLDGPAATRLIQGLEGRPFRIASAEEKPFSKAPAAPFTTSTLQQEGNLKLSFDARRTMRAAQRLYESGYITYMRTDSVFLSDQAIQATRAAVEELYGRDYLPDAPRVYRNKVKNAQEAHEAIRPAGDRIAPIDEVAQKLGPDEARVYELIWKRTMACQMKDLRGRRMTLVVEGTADGQVAAFQATGSVIDFPGFKRAYVEGSSDPDEALAEQETVLPPVKEGEQVQPRAITPEEHVTQPPARLNEASLVKALEESGVGRPSTYASIIETIQRRDYTFKKGNALVPTFTAFAVVNLMREHLTDLVDVDFTARMEDRLDAIARGEGESLPYLREFYFGNGAHGLRPLLDQKAEDIDPRAVCSLPLGRGADGEEIVVRVGRYGPYLQRGEEKGNIPDGICPDELTIERAEELLRAGQRANEPLGAHPDTGEPVYVKSGRFGPYVQQGDAQAGSKTRPKMVSLLPGMSVETLTFEQALDLLRLPRTLGSDAEGVEVVAHLGRYGPYIKRGSDTRSLEPGDDVLTVELPRALELLAQEKKAAFRRQPKELKAFESVAALGGAAVKLLAGRYGPYVTDGEYNASLPRDFGDALTLTEEQAAQLILEQRAKGPPKKKAGKKKPARKKAAAADAGDEGAAPKKKAAAKKATAKKPAAKKAAAKKPAAKKPAAGEKPAAKKPAAKKAGAGKTAARTSGRVTKASARVAAQSDDEEGTRRATPRKIASN